MSSRTQRSINQSALGLSHGEAAWTNHVCPQNMMRGRATTGYVQYQTIISKKRVELALLHALWLLNATWPLSHPRALSKGRNRAEIRHTRCFSVGNATGLQNESNKFATHADNSRKRAGVRAPRGGGSFLLLGSACRSDLLNRTLGLAAGFASYGFGGLIAPWRRSRRCPVCRCLPMLAALLGLLLTA